MNATIENLTVSSPMLPAAMKAVGYAITRSNSRPVLRCAKLTATENGFIAYATNLETAVVVTVGGYDSTPIGETLVPAVAASGIAKIKGTASVVFKGDRIESLGASVPVDDAAEYPSGYARIDSPPEAELTMEFVRLMDGHVANATDNESTRYALGAILLERRGEYVQAVGTDGRRLHVLTTAGKSLRGDFNALVSPHAVRTLVKAVDAVAAAVAGKAGKAARDGANAVAVAVRLNGGIVELSWHSGAVSIRVSERMTEGRFPRWRDCIGVNHFDAPSATFATDVGVDQIKAAARVTSEASKGVKLSRGMIEAISATNGEYSAPFCGTAPAGMCFKLDPRFWIDAANGVEAIDGQNLVTVHSRGKARGVYFRSGHGLTPSAGAIGFAAVVMPLAAD